MTGSPGLISKVQHLLITTPPSARQDVTVANTVAQGRLETRRGEALLKGLAQFERACEKAHMEPEMARMRQEMQRLRKKLGK